MIPRLLRLARWLLTAAVVVYCVHTLWRSWTSLDTSTLSFEPGFAVISVLAGGAALLGLAGLSLAGLRVAGLPEGSYPPGLSRMWTRVWLQSYLYRYVPGKVMLLVERARLGARFGIPSATSVVLALWESQLLIAGAGLIAGASLLSRPARPDDPVSGLGVSLLAGGALLGSILLWPTLRFVAARVPAIGRRVPGLVLSVPVAAQLGLALGYAGVWLGLGLSFAWCAAAITPGSTPDVGLLVAWFVTSYVGGQVASVTPAGLGVREGLLVAGLAHAAPAPAVLAWAVAHRVGLSVVELVLLGASMRVRLPDPPEPR